MRESVVPLDLALGVMVVITRVKDRNAEIAIVTEIRSNPSHHKRAGDIGPPQGHLHEDEETFTTAAVREAWEETGLSVQLIGGQRAKFQVGSALCCTYLAEPIDPYAPLHAHEDDVENPRWVKLEWLTQQTNLRPPTREVLELLRPVLENLDKRATHN